MANLKISDMTPVPTALDGTELLEISVLGSPNQTYSCTTQDIADLVVAESGTPTNPVTGPVSSVDNTIPRFDGVTGDLIQGSDVVISDLDELYGFKAFVDLETAASYEFVEADSGMIKELNDGTGVTAVLPATLPKGFMVTVMQAGAGAISFIPESGATVLNRQGHASSAGQYAMCTLYVRSNSGSDAVWVLGGDTAT